MAGGGSFHLIIYPHVILDQYTLLKLIRDPKKLL